MTSTLTSFLRSVECIKSNVTAISTLKPELVLTSSILIKNPVTLAKAKVATTNTLILIGKTVLYEDFAYPGNINYINVIYPSTTTSAGSNLVSSTAGFLVLSSNAALNVASTITQLRGGAEVAYSYANNVLGALSSNQSANITEYNISLSNTVNTNIIPNVTGFNTSFSTMQFYTIKGLSTAVAYSKL